MSTTTRTYAEVAAGVNAAIATYIQAMDAGSVDDVVATFCSDGVFELSAYGTYAQGHDELRTYFSTVLPEVGHRHATVNTLLTAWSDHEVTATSDMLAMSKRDGGWAIHNIGRYQDTLRIVDDTWRFERRTLAFVD